MKRLLLFLALLLPLAAAAQPTLTVKNAMDGIAETFSVYFVYDASLQVDVPTTFHIDPESNLQKNLRKLFEDTGINWYVKANYVILNECCATLRQAPVWPEPVPERYLAPVTMMDTLKEAVKTARHVLQMTPGGYQFAPSLAQRIVTPLGEGDALKYVQSLPGVSAGGEGMTSLHVRGGEMGSNAVTLDGVPIYGISHLMGLAFVLPSDVTGVSEFQAGGFRADAGNFTASHLRLQSYSGDFERARARFTVNPFLTSASVSTPMKKGKSSFLASVRFSPVGLEYKAFKKMVDRYQDAFDDMDATVGDLYAKFTVRPDGRNEFAFSLFGSLDNYRFDMPVAVSGPGTTEKMGWSNAIANLSWDTRPTAVFDCIHSSLSLNDHRWNQEQITRQISKENIYFRYKMSSTIDELMLQSTGSKQWERWSLHAGIQLRSARFNPTARSQYMVRMNPTGRGILYQEKQFQKDNPTWAMISALYGEIDYAVPERLLLRFSLRGNLYYAKQTETDRNMAELKSHFYPEAGMLAQLHLNAWLGLEGSVDYRTQFYHSLETMPTGWAFDPIIAPEYYLPPERMLQGYLGLFGRIGEHSFRAGGFYKQMWDLTFYKNKKTTEIYSSGEDSWRENIFVGDGNAYGAEFLYEKEGRNLSWQISYTWSKCTRQFPVLAEGTPFPARYDRRHMLHAGARWKGLTASFTLQSGHHESISIFQYFGYPSFAFELPYNWQVPAFIRLDLGYRFSFQSGKTHPVNHNLTVGVYNLLNRHNASQITFDPTEMKWKLISYFPIMPSITYQLEL
jgi:hypothetical protein